MGKKPKLLVILGPNASGKSALAVLLAKKFNGEIISADSRQVYRGMNIGTGKVPRDKSKVESPRPRPSLAEGGQRSKLQSKIQNDYFYKEIRHHLLDVADPKRRFTVAQYKKLALAAIKKIQRKNKIPIICGGTGFYIQALVDNISIPEVKPDFKLRAKLEKKTAQELFSELKKLDPGRAKQIDRFNKRRLIRALEIVLKTGKPVPVLNPLQPSFTKGGGVPPFEKGRVGGIFSDTLFIGIKKSPAELKKLIHKRLIKRLRQGMIEEVKKLRNSGLSWHRLEDFGLEYRWLARYLQKKINYQEMIIRLQKDIEHFAKRQMTWFKRDKKIHWVKNKNQVYKLINHFLK